ncbi:extracellular solute-binding protein [Actinospica robiniae]|uniref:extracellular solute-binding protein n=1 Tax=Actinospica robiniae TaxID=304901 RepID=UPI000407F059|nr:extracellular solute-binding protein [Actinospica robiniae]
MRTRIAPALGVAVALALGAAGCSSSSAPAGAGSAPGVAIAGAGSGTGKTLTVWYMQDDLTSTTVDAIDSAFTAATGAKVKVQIQQWANINTKLITALAQNDPPDVIEIGNTDVPMFAASGGLTDITSALPQLSAGQTWLTGLEGPATVSGHSYAAPLFAGERAVVYNKAIWAAAGITSTPTSFTELTADLDKIKAKNTAPDFSAFYVPGQYWFGGMQFVWDAGGQIATESGGKWTGALESPQAIAGLQAYKSFLDTYSTPASQNVTNTVPDYNNIFAQGKTAAILNTNVNGILKIKPGMKDQIGSFPFPSSTAGKNQPVFLGGSDLAIAKKSPNQALALAYLKTATSTQVQTADIAGVDGWTPVSTQLIDSTSAARTPVLQAFSEAAKDSVATPATPGWATIEADNSLQSFFADVATGRKSVQAAAQAFDQHLDQALNAAPSE